MPRSSDSRDESIALLIDADNAPSSKIEFIISELASYGTVDVRRAYGNWKKTGLRGWEAKLAENAIEPVQMFDLVKGKNATDMRLLIDAMDLLHGSEVGTFAIVSSDCDFTPLCIRIRAAGKSVIGFGSQNTPDAFVNACSVFLYLDDEEEGRKVPSLEERRSGNALKGNTKLMKSLRNAVATVADEDGWAQLGGVGSVLANQSPVDHRSFGFSKLSDLFTAIDLFEVESTKKGNITTYRVRSRD